MIRSMLVGSLLLVLSPLSRGQLNPGALARLRGGAVTPGQKAMQPVEDPDREPTTMERMTTFTIASVNVEDMGVEEFFQELQHKCLEADSTGQGINIVLQVAQPSAIRPITMNMRNLPLEDVIRYVCMMTGLQYRFDRNAVVVTQRGAALNRGTTAYVTRFYGLPAGWSFSNESTLSRRRSDDFEFRKSSTRLRQQASVQDATAFFRDMGITFPGGTRATYVPRTHKLGVTHTEEMHRRILELMKGLAE